MKPQENESPTNTDSATLREIAVRVEADPRTVRKVLTGAPVRGMVGRRIRRALEKLNLLPEKEEGR